MKRIKEFTATALALTLCFGLTACSNETSPTPTPAPDAGTTAPAPTPEADAPGDGEENQDETGGEVTYESYLAGLNAYTENFMSIQETSTTATEGFLADPTNPDSIAGYVAMLEEMQSLLGEISQVTPTEDMAEIHQNFVDSCTAVTDNIGQIVEILGVDLENVSDETLEEYNTLYQDFSDNYIAFATNLFDIADELQVKMG